MSELKRELKVIETKTASVINKKLGRFSCSCGNSGTFETFFDTRKFYCKECGNKVFYVMTASKKLKINKWNLAGDKIFADRIEKDFIMIEPDGTVNLDYCIIEVVKEELDSYKATLYRVEEKGNIQDLSVKLLTYQTTQELIDKYIDVKYPGIEEYKCVNNVIEVFQYIDKPVFKILGDVHMLHLLSMTAGYNNMSFVYQGLNINNEGKSLEEVFNLPKSYIDLALYISKGDNLSFANAITTVSYIYNGDIGIVMAKHMLSTYELCDDYNTMRKYKIYTQIIKHTGESAETAVEIVKDLDFIGEKNLENYISMALFCGKKIKELPKVKDLVTITNGWVTTADKIRKRETFVKLKNISNKIINEVELGGYTFTEPKTSLDFYGKMGKETIGENYNKFYHIDLAYTRRVDGDMVLEFVNNSDKENTGFISIDTSGNLKGVFCENQNIKKDWLKNKLRKEKTEK